MKGIQPLLLPASLLVILHNPLISGHPTDNTLLSWFIIYLPKSACVLGGRGHEGDGERDEIAATTCS